VNECVAACTDSRFDDGIVQRDAYRLAASSARLAARGSRLAEFDVAASLDDLSLKAFELAVKHANAKFDGDLQPALLEDGAAVDRHLATPSLSMNPGEIVFTRTPLGQPPWTGPCCTSSALSWRRHRPASPRTGATYFEWTTHGQRRGSLSHVARGKR